MQENTLEGRGPPVVRATEGGKREGMGVSPNTPDDTGRALQRRLWMCATRRRTRRFHALYDRLYRSDVLWEAWQRVRRNGGAAGVDAQTLAAIERSGVAGFLRDLQATLRAGQSRPRPVRRGSVPKTDGTPRPRGIPTVRDRVVPRAAQLVVDPIFEADFVPASYGFRPKRNAAQALEAIRAAGNQGDDVVIEADVHAYFDRIDQRRVMELVSERISDRRVLQLIRKGLEAGVVVDGTVRETLAGTPQGGVISPLLANIALHAFDRHWEQEGETFGRLVRYADDFVVMCQRKAQAHEAYRRVEALLTRLGLPRQAGKTRLVDVRNGKAGFTFRGCTSRQRRSIPRNPRWYAMQRWPSPQAMEELRGRIRELTSARGNQAREVKDVITSLNPVLRGWGTYFRTSHADRECNEVDHDVRHRILRWQWRRHGQRSQFHFDQWPSDRLYRMGLHRLQGTVAYRTHATPVRPSVSRVRENRMHGLNGGLWRPGPAMATGA